MGTEGDGCAGLAEVVFRAALILPSSLTSCAANKKNKKNAAWNIQ